MSIKHINNLILLILLMTISGGISIFMGTSRDWDFLHYHFYNGYALLHHRLNIDFAPAGLWSFFNPLLDAFNALLILNIQNTFWILFILGALCGLGVFVFYKILTLIFENIDPAVCSKQSKHVLIFFALFLGITAPSVFSQMGATSNDFQSASFFLLGIYCALKFLIQDKKTYFLLLLAGVFTGVAVGLKLTNGSYVIALSAAIFFSAPRHKKFTFTALMITGVLIGFFVSNGWWMWMLYEKFKSPFFPLYNQIFHSPEYPFLNYKDASFSIHSWKDIFVRPFQYAGLNRLASEQAMSDPRLLLSLFLSLFIFIYFVRSKLSHKHNNTTKDNNNYKNQTVIKFLGTYLWVGYTVWLIQFGIYRYAIPLELMASTFIFFACGNYFFQTSKQKKWTGLLFFFIFITTTIIIPVRPPFMPKQYITVTPPTMTLPSDSLIVLTGVKQSFAIPFFPSDVIFLNPYFVTGVPSPGTHPIKNIKGIQKIRQEAAEHKPIYLLFGHDKQNNPHHSVGVLKLADLTFKSDLSSCERLDTNSYRQTTLELCKAELIRAAS